MPEDSSEIVWLMARASNRSDKTWSLKLTWCGRCWENIFRDGELLTKGSDHRGELILRQHVVGVAVKELEGLK